MRSLVRSLRSPRTSIPVPWTSLARLIAPRPGNLLIAQSAAGVGKSTFALAWAMGVGAPALYVSLDTDIYDQAVRTVAALTGRPTWEIAKNGREWADWLERQQLLVRITHQEPRIDEVLDLLMAEIEYWGEPPVITIVDNASNLLEKEESSVEYNRIFKALHAAAKKTRTCILALHHLKRQPKKGSACRRCGEPEPDVGTTPVGLQDGLYAGDREVEILLGLWKPDPGHLTVGVIKNRMGRAGTQTSLICDLERARVQEPSQVAQYAESIGVGGVS